MKPPAAVALVGGAGALTSIGTVQVPGTVYAASDGADAPNAAIAAGAAATGGLSIAGGADGNKDPDGDCDNDPRKIVEDTAREVVEEWGLAGLDRRISAGQWDHPEYIWAYRGSEVHKETARRLGERYPDLFDGTMNGKGPDFSVKGTDKLVELTTSGELAGHKRKGGAYNSCEYAIYDFKK